MRAAKFFLRSALCAPVFAAAVLSGGCALPVGVQVALFAFDGFSLAMTDKTIAGHGLSAASGQDCALHRVVTDAEGGPVCRDNDSGVMTASGDWTPEDRWKKAREGGISEPHAPLLAARDAERAEIRAVALKLNAPAPAESADADTGAAPAALDANAVLRTAGITDGRYMVIGTYRTMENAERLALKRRAFNPRVLVTELRSGELYRVVVGPYAESEHRQLTRELARAGMFDVWAMGVIAEDWPKVWAPAPGPQVAGAE